MSLVGPYRRNSTFVHLSAGAGKPDLTKQRPIDVNDPESDVWQSDKRRRAGNVEQLAANRRDGSQFNAASPPPSGLTQTVDEMRVVLWTKPRGSVADIHI